ncbi:MAG: undecaprenyl-diphosphatase [Gammaproteobacteria bacterium HGW-Gammaproteobacteria-3]|nr:MAG: undecaprenyl-diphosphatase [Gammaproteobacteria bacterium HGW-Gammaproteobacteria-3]
MDWILALKALILGIVEGLTEFLPISSTGHLILTADLLGFNGGTSKVFLIVIQTGAILAICWEYHIKIAAIIAGLFKRDAAALKFTVNLMIAFMPLAFLGLLFGSLIKTYLFKPIPVALAFIVGGIIIFWAEKRDHRIRIHVVEELTRLDALKLGFAQALALIPGTSRSGSTIIGGLLFGLSRKAATEFSFFLAIPTLIIASLYDLYKHWALLHNADLPLFGVGLLAAFFSALLAVRALLRYISHHDFTVFAWYRIVFGLLVIVTAYGGWVKWTVD